MNYWLLKFEKKTNGTHNCDIFLCSNMFTWYTKYIFWQILFLGFYFDEIFSKIIKTIYLKILFLSGYFFFDKYFASWVGVRFFNNFLTIFNNFFFFERLDFFFFFISILNIFMYFFIYLLFIFFFYI